MGEQCKFRCVKVYGHPETQKLMDEAFQCMKDEELAPEHFSEKECFDIVKKEKNVVYMFDVFEGDAFEHIVGLGYRAYGPMCILTCASYKQGIPRFGRLVYNLAMKDVKVCCTNVDTEKRKSIYGKVEWMGGNINKDFTQDVTHLVAGAVGGKKYQAAVSFNIQIMSPEWVPDVWEKSKLQAVHGKDEQFQIHRCPVFLGCVVTVSGLSSDERKEVKHLVEKEGGRYSGEMSMKESTHLIINEPKGQKYLFALKWNILVVKSEWLYDSIEKGLCQDEANYKLTASNEDNRGQMKTSTPERLSLAANGIGDISNISMISMMNVNETKFNSTTMSTISHIDDPDPVETLDIAKQVSEMFLDGCKIYLSGFRGAALEKLRKIINIGGGTRFNQITDNLTHVIVGERIEGDIDQIKALSIRPHVVTSQWICDCFKQETILDGFNYASKELPLDPTTPKKKGTKKSVKTAQDNQKPSTSKQDFTLQNENGPGEDDMEDIMSQYLTKPSDPEETREDDKTVLEPLNASEVNNQAPAPPVDDGDLTQDPNSLTVEDENLGLFQRKTFVFLGFEEEILSETWSLVKEHGGGVCSKGQYLGYYNFIGIGVVLQSNSRQIPDFAVVPIYGFPVDRTVGDIVTNVWMDCCIEQGVLLDCHSNPLFSPLEIQVGSNPLKDCVLSTSGYTGTERDIILQIAEILGATNQDSFLRIAKKGLLASTQLIVNAPSGSKYQAAKKWGIPAVSKRWLLACAKSGKLELVENYLIENESEMTNKVMTTTSSMAQGDKQRDPSLTEARGETVDQYKDLRDPKESEAQPNRSQTSAKSIGSAHSNDIQAAESLVRKETRTNVENEVFGVDDARGIAGNETSGMKGPDFSTTGDTEALLLGLNTQGEQNTVNQEINQIQDRENSAVNKNQSVSNEESILKGAQTVIQENSAGKRSDLGSLNKDTDLSPVRDIETAAITNDKRSLGFASGSKKNETGDQNNTKLGNLPLSVKERLLPKTPILRNWRAELRKTQKEEDKSSTRSSQKENISSIMVTPVQSRVKELRNQQGAGAMDKDTPSKFLNPNVEYIPKFDTEEFKKCFPTPEDVRAARAKRRSSIPFDDLFATKMAKAEQQLLRDKEAKERHSQKSQDEGGTENLDQGVLQGVIISVAKKLLQDQSDLNDLVSSLGGGYRWNYDESCTHFIFQGKRNDTAKDFRMAKEDGCKIVHPHWLFMCKEQNARVDEALYPHTFNPNLSLSVVSTKRTPLRTPARSTRRAARERIPSKAEELQTKPQPVAVQDNMTPKRNAQVVALDVETRKKSPTVINLKQSKESLKSPSSAAAASDEDKKGGESENVTEIGTGGSLEMREMLSKQLENVMAESKGKKKRRSKRLNCSGGQVATPEENTSLKSQRRTQENTSRNSGRTPRSTSEMETKGEEKTSLEMGPSQSVQVVWDDPMGRMEQEKLAHKLERACSPTQDSNTFYDADPEDAQYSESDGETDIPVPTFEKQPEEKVTPKADKNATKKTPTPEGPSIAFPTNSKMDRITPPKPVMMEETEEHVEKTPPVFMLSGMSQAERDDFGALVERLGGKLLDCQQFDPSCTHLVISTITRNEKLLGSIAAGKWVLHKSYFEACRQENIFVQEDLYEWGSEGTLSLVKNLDSNVRLLTAAARDWRIRVQEERKTGQTKCGAFCTWRVILCCDKNREGNYKRLLEAGGATVLNQKPPFTEKVEATHVLMELHKVSLSQDDLEVLLSSGCLCLKPEFICAHLSDSNVDIQSFTPSEIIALKAVLTDSSENTRKRRKPSSSEASVKRSKRR